MDIVSKHCYGKEDLYQDCTLERTRINRRFEETPSDLQINNRPLSSKG